MFLRKITVAIILCLAFFVQSAFCAENYKVKDLLLDSSDKMVFIRGIGNFKSIPQTSSYVPIPTQNTNSVNLITDITAFKMTNPSRYVIDIPNAVLINSSRIYKIQNSSVLNNIQMSQFRLTLILLELFLMSKKRRI